MLFRKQGQKLWHLFFVNENVVQQNAGRTKLQLTFWELSYHTMSRTEEAQRTHYLLLSYHIIIQNHFDTYWLSSLTFLNIMSYQMLNVLFLKVKSISFLTESMLYCFAWIHIVMTFCLSCHTSWIHHWRQPRRNLQTIRYTAVMWGLWRDYLHFLCVFSHFTCTCLPACQTERKRWVLLWDAERTVVSPPSPDPLFRFWLHYISNQDSRQHLTLDLAATFKWPHRSSRHFLSVELQYVSWKMFYSLFIY